MKFSRQLIALWLLLLVNTAWSASSRIMLVSSSCHFALVHRIESLLFTQCHAKPQITHILADKLTSEQQLINEQSPDLVVTIGYEALAEFLKTGSDRPVLAVYLRKYSYDALINEYSEKTNFHPEKITAIYLDQPIERQLLFIKHLFAGRNYNSLGVLLGPYSKMANNEILQLADAHGIRMVRVFVEQDDNPVEVLDGLLNESKVVLAVPDSKIYNAKTARGILLTTFHNTVPLIGYSKTFVNNGALGAIFASIHQISEQTVAGINTILANPAAPLPACQYAADFTIGLNQQVANTLNFKLPSEEALYQLMEQEDTVG